MEAFSRIHRRGSCGRPAKWLEWRSEIPPAIVIGGLSMILTCELGANAVRLGENAQPFPNKKRAFDHRVWMHFCADPTEAESARSNRLNRG
jgi:hypothetical protein